MAAPNIGHSVIRVVNFFVVVLLVFILINLLAQPIISAIPSVGQNVSAIIGGLWQGVKDTVLNVTSAASGNNTAAATNAAAPTAVTVTIEDPFTPPNFLEVAPRATITVDNQTGVAHTVMAENESFTSVSIPANGSGTIIAPNSPGSYIYYVDSTSTRGTLTVRSVR